MEISEITIKNFKGIEEVKMEPIRPINILIGRNNSGKSSVLACLQLLNKYFTNREFIEGRQLNPTIKIPDEYFRKNASNDTWFEISVTVRQTKEERKKQFENVIKDRNKQYGERLDEGKVAIKLEKELLSNITFDFRGVRKDIFGLTSIRATEEGKYENIAIEPNYRPGNFLRSLALLSLFEDTRIPREFDSLSKLAKENKEGIEIGLGGGELIETKGSVNKLSGVELLKPAFRHIKETFWSIFMVSPYRHGAKHGNGARCQMLNEDGVNIVNRLHDLHMNNNRIFEEVAGFVKRIAPDVGRLHTRHAGSGNELELAYDWTDDRVVNLANMGGGVEQLLILGCILIQQKMSCILWEEPESHLHPGAQDILLSELEKRIKDSRIFISTHSPVFIRSSDKIAVHIITNPDGKSGKGRTLLSDELQEAASVLGSRPGHLAMADIVVYVEGKWGAAAFEEWLKKWSDRDKVLGHLLLAIQFFSPDDMGTKDFDLVPLRKMTPNMIMFVDKDNNEGSSKPKPSRQELQEKCKALGIPCIITEKRQIEDYFTEDAVKQGLPSNILAGWKYEASKPMGEQLPTKKYNAKIAAAMKWEDIEKHKDIIQVFEEIKKYVKTLKPDTNGG
jgi:energy-coupling factor transporter ATP-binding protein EcfA2